MDKKNVRLSAWQAGWFGIALALCAVLLFIGGTGTSAQAGAAKAASPNVTCPAGQCFTDVPSGNSFYANVNALYMDGIIGGYPCGGTGEPCDADNRPYYRPANLVSRQQMSKFVDLGRRNIADAIGISLHLTDTTGISLVLSNTTTDSIDAYNSSGAEAIQSICTRANQNCWAFYSSAATGDYAAVLSGGRGVSVTSGDDNYAALDANSNGTGSYGGELSGANYRGARIYSGTPASWYGLYVDQVGSTVGSYLGGDTYVDGSLTVIGGCTGCLSGGVTVQNVGATPLAMGDVVTLVGSGPAVVGSSPVVLVKKASGAYDTSAAGIVSGAMYVPDAATQAAYAQQQETRKAASDARQKLMSDALAKGEKADPGQVTVPAATITDAQGTVHADNSVTTIAPNSYATILTGGTYQTLKVDASFGAIKTGDLLTTSSNPGYAMKVTDKSQALGAVIGKAMGDLSSGTGTIPVLVTLK